MPYTANSDNLPENVKKLPKKKKAQWIHVYDSAISSGKPESTAFAMANGVVKKELEEETKAYIETWEIDKLQLSQEQANYNPMGGTNEKACSGCQFYAPGTNSCVVVSGDIAPNGVSDYFIAKFAEEENPYPVYIVDSPGAKEFSQVEKHKNLLEKMKEFALGKSASPFLLYEKDGALRWFAYYSNCFKDRDGEILTSDAHKEYADWVEKSGEYPDLWLWHTPGSKIGKADWIDFDGAFACASGTIDPGMEDIAYKVVEDDPGISHGFLAPYEKPGGIVNWYRSFEISALPISKAANLITGLNLLKENGDDMTFTPQRREYLLKVGMSEETVAKMETNSESLQKQLKDQGLEYKGEEDTEDTTPDVSQEGVKLVLEQLVTLQDSVTQLATAVGAQGEEIKSLKESDSEKIHKAFEAEIAKVGGGFRASKEESTETDPATNTQTAEDVRWFTDGIIGKALEDLGARK